MASRLAEPAQGNSKPGMVSGIKEVKNTTDKAQIDQSSGKSLMKFGLGSGLVGIGVLVTAIVCISAAPFFPFVLIAAASVAAGGAGLFLTGAMLSLGAHNSDDQADTLEKKVDTQKSLLTQTSAQIQSPQGLKNQQHPDQFKKTGDSSDHGVSDVLDGIECCFSFFACFSD